MPVQGFPLKVLSKQGFSCVMIPDPTKVIQEFVGLPRFGGDVMHQWITQIHKNMAWVKKVHCLTDEELQRREPSVRSLVDLSFAGGGSSGFSQFLRCHFSVLYPLRVTSMVDGETVEQFLNVMEHRAFHYYIIVDEFLNEAQLPGEQRPPFLTTPYSIRAERDQGFNDDMLTGYVRP